MSSQAHKEIIKMSYAFFSENVCSDKSINRYLDRVAGWLKDSNLERDAIYDELTRLHNVHITGSDAILDGKGDHEEWFNASTGQRLHGEIEWRFWDHYQLYLINGKNWPREVVENLDRETNKILSRLEDPGRAGHWDRRGLVLGSVQSGKTANYTGLIAKAIDAGYKLIVVLAGVHNSLRSQTQFRLNEEILGYHLDQVREFDDQARLAGVRRMFPNHPIAQTLTNAGEAGDFKKTVAESAGIIPTQNGSPIILVVKKHVSILKNLLDWATAIIGKRDSTGRVVVEDIPLLLIDDECDYASVNTKKVVKDENGTIDEECDPAKTNLRIRELLTTFHKSIYVGYTATPFANIFIHHDEQHPKYGQDLFPRNFIISLPQPSNYFGPARMFGLNENTNAGIEAREPLPLLRTVADADAVFPLNHKKDLQVAELPDSLKKAIRVFLLTCAIRRIRENSPAHNSMLVHVTRFTLVQGQVRDLVEKELKRTVDRIRSGKEAIDDLKDLWMSDVVPTTDSMEAEFGCRNAAWDEVVQHLYPIAKRVKVKAINGSAKESLDYRQAEMEAKIRIENGEDVPWEERGENVISIGGDKLSRGLTLDGLTVSYYLRASKMFDTLMQMGRWFGYRDGYQDLCRIFTTSTLIRWYRFIATSSIELKEDIKYMELLGEEPQNFGLKVQDHPGQLAITSAGKRRNSETLSLSFSGGLHQTIVFDTSKSASNIEALRMLVESMDSSSRAQRAQWETGTTFWSNLTHEAVVEFLDSYETDTEAAKAVSPSKWSTFIKLQIAQALGDLTEWTVAIFSKTDSPRTLEIDGYEFNCFERKPDGPPEGGFAIGTLVSPTDEWLDFDKTERDELKEQFGGQPTGKQIRVNRPKTRGFLMIYPIFYNAEQYLTYGVEPDVPVIGVAISFPESDTTIKARYQVNAVYRDAED